MRYKDTSKEIFKALGIAGILVAILVKLVHFVCFKSVGMLYSAGTIKGRFAGKVFYFLFFVLAVSGVAAVTMRIGS